MEWRVNLLWAPNYAMKEDGGGGGGGGVGVWGGGGGGGGGMRSYIDYQDSC